MPALPPEQWASALHFDALEAQHGLPPGLLGAVVTAESQGDHAAENPRSGAQGLFQFMPDTAKSYKIDPYDPLQAAPAAAQELGSLYGKYQGNLSKTLAGWNWGQGRVDRLGMAKAPGETQGFIAKVTGLLSPASAEASSPGGIDLADFDRWLGTQGAPAGGAMGPGTPAQGTPRHAPADGEGLPMETQVLPNTDPNQPAILAPPGAASGPGTGGYQMSIDIAKPSEGNPPPAQFGPPAASVRLQPGMTGDQLARAYGYDPAQFTPAQLQRLQTFAEDTTPLPFGADPGSFAGRAMHAMWANVQGGGQLLARGLLKTGLMSQADVAHEELMAKIDATKYARAANPSTHAYPIIGDPAELAGNVAFGAMIPGLGGAPSVLTGAGAGAIQPITDTSTTPGAPGDPFASQKRWQTGTGAVLGPAVEYGVVRPLMWGVNKAINGTRGLLAGLKGDIPPGDAALLDVAAAHGVEPTYSDVRGAMGAPRASRREIGLEKTWGSGAGEVRQAQQTQTKTAAQAFQQHYVDATGQATYDALPAAARLAATGDRQAARAVALAQQAGDDPGAIMQAGANLNLQALRGRANELYARTRALAAPLGDVPPQRTLAQAYAAMDAMEQATVGIDPTGSTRTHLKGILDRLEPQTSAPDALGRTTTTTPPTPYAVMDKLSNDLGTLLDQPHMRDTYGAKLLGAVKQAADQDMREFAMKSGNAELARAQIAADTFYPQVVRQREMVRTIEGMQPDEVARYMFQPRRGDRAADWFQALDSKGQAAARAEILTQALYDGPSPAIQPSTGTFSPARFAQNLERMRDVTGVVFPKGGEVRWQVDGFVNLMRHMERAGQYAENPPTGQRLSGGLHLASTIVSSVAGGQIKGIVGAIGAPIALVAAEAAKGRLAKVLLMNPAGRNFLLAASNAQPGSPAMQRVMTGLAERLPALIGQMEGQEQGEAPAPRSGATSRPAVR